MIHKHQLIAAVCTALLVSVAFGPATCNAQNFAKRLAIHPSVGMGIPVGDFGEETNPGPVFGGKLRVNLHEYFSLDLTFVHGPNYGLSDEPVTDPNINFDARTKITQVTLDNNVYIHKPGKVKPFFRFGLGLYRFGAEVESSFQGMAFNTSTSENHFGINLGPGIEIKTANRTSLVFDVNYHNIFPNTNQNESVKMFSFGAGINIYMN